jgi:hypothetical protein
VNIVCITGGTRPTLLHQTLDSMMNNAENWNAHTLTVVFDGLPEEGFKHVAVGTLIYNRYRLSASACRNIGAGSVPKYRRQQWLMFCDDDVWFAPKWDVILMDLTKLYPRHIISAYGHPFNIEDARPGVVCAKFPIVISSVCPLMSWGAFDEIGWWIEPGGPGSSEDVHYCARAAKLRYGFVITNPHRAIHTGLTSFYGGKIVGYEHLVAQNKRLEALYGVTGKVVYS